MDQFTSLFSRFPPEAVAHAESRLQRDMSSTNKNLLVIPPDPINEAKASSLFPSMEGLNEDQVRESFLSTMLQSAKPRFPPLETLPCANVEVNKYKICEQPGTLACSACKLVSYCSPDCQKSHWRIHKVDCKNKIRSDKWQPNFIADKRTPAFISNESPAEEFARKQVDEFSHGLSLWGNIPAMDIINLSQNENDATKDFSLAFVASGDLRHIVRSVNCLPSNYSGNLTIMINDLALPTTCRNVLLLLILGTISDQVMAADLALHFWYSAFMPAEYSVQLSAALTSFLKHMMRDEPISSYPLGSHAKLSGCFPLEAKKYFTHYISQSFSMDEAQTEYDRVRTAPSRKDYRDRMYSGLRPSHRVAFQEYRRFGIVLPFGAINAHFNVPNASLFSLQGKWWQTDYADPLEGWDVDAIIEAGKAHGGRAEDIYGCLYFYLSDQLRLFAERLQKFRISFSVFSFEATQLADLIRDNKLVSYKIPASIRFDRIEVSNILDDNYVGLEGVLKGWAPLLAQGECATIIGYFMNWAILAQPDGSVLNARGDVLKKLMGRMFKEGKIDRLKKIANAKGTMPSNDDILSLVMEGSTDMQVLYDNSQPFLKYLKKKNLDNTLQATKLRKKKIHTIVPRRIHASLGGPEDALPEFPDDDSWYYHTRLNSHTWTERFVEFARM